MKAVVGVMHTTIQRWVRWYEEGGIEGVARHKRGSMKTPRQAWTAEQEARLRQAVLEGRFRRIGEAVRWCAEVLGMEAPYGLWRWGYWKKVLRPLAPKADVEAQEVWKKAFWKRSVEKV